MVLGVESLVEGTGSRRPRVGRCGERTPGARPGVWRARIASARSPEVAAPVPERRPTRAAEQITRPASAGSGSSGGESVAALPGPTRRWRDRVEARRVAGPGCGGGRESASGHRPGGRVGDHDPALVIVERRALPCGGRTRLAEPADLPPRPSRAPRSSGGNAVRVERSGSAPGSAAARGALASRGSPASSGEVGAQGAQLRRVRQDETPRPPTNPRGRDTRKRDPTTPPVRGTAWTWPSNERSSTLRTCSG